MMKNIIPIRTKAFILVIAFGCFFFPNLYAQTSQNQESVETKQIAVGTSQEAKKSRPRVNFVKKVNFYLRDGKLVGGKLVSEDKNGITIEQVDESRIVVSTYSKREIDVRTLNTRTLPEAKHYVELAEYFYGKTWDFRDDPDDFIQAIRCYEKAKQSVAQTHGQDSEKIGEINQKIEQLQADRQVWIREVESPGQAKETGI